jgi:PIN domain nuclease of toxin-antitoxin system
MNLLIDTHTFLWMDANPARLSTTAATLLADPNNAICLSVVSLWEIQIKSMLGKLQLRVPLSQIVDDNIKRNGLVVLSISAEQVYELDQLPAVHNDPFDRLLVCAARQEGATLVSADPIFLQYPVSVQW